MTEVVIHSLKTKDLSTLTGECSVCGLVAIAKSGTGYQCSVKKKAAQQAWREKNPAKSAEDRRRKSDHELFDHDYRAETAKCVQCGEVDIILWGRGYACGVRARELRANQETVPQRPCRECLILDGDRVYPINGECPRCADPTLYDTGTSLRNAECRASDLDGTPDGFGVVDLANFDPYGMPDDESVVPGWNRHRTLGSHTRPWNQV